MNTKSDKLPKWVKVSKTEFNEILSIITEAKNNGLKVNADGEEITLHKAESLLKDISSKKINKNEFIKRHNDIIKNVKKLLTKQTYTMNRKKLWKFQHCYKISFWR